MEYGSDPAGFVVDFDDPEDIRIKMAQAERNADEREAVLADMEKLRLEADRWRARARFLKSQLPEVPAPEAAPSSNGNHDSTSTVALAVSVVNREVRKIRAKDVQAILSREGHDLPRAAVANALYYAAKRARLIQAAPGRGMYAPHPYKEELLYDSTVGGPEGG